MAAERQERTMAEHARTVVDLPIAYPPIEHYAIIGDCRSAGLVSRDGSLDWLCWPRFDSPSVFAALLDAGSGGRFRIQPTGPFQTQRRYLPDTNLLETRFSTATGAIVLRDLMPVASEADKRRELTAEHEVLREIEGVSGQVEIDIFYQPRPDYGRQRISLEQRGELGLRCGSGSGALVLRSDAPLTISDDRQSATATLPIAAGERKFLSLSYTQEGPTVLPTLGAGARDRVERSAAWWREWAAGCAYEGPYRDVVIRSALALKLMSYAPSGAVIAAPTTSLPERLGGERNWDYRYCWLRDASFTLQALAALGKATEAAAYVDWLLHATRLTSPELDVLYDLYGGTNVRERQLDHLEGYAGSLPVRIGNNAHGQLQLDVYGEVLDAVAEFIDRGGRVPFDRDTVRFLDGLGQTVCAHWREPDEGIWEGRAGRFHHTHSKVLCWVALDRLIDLHEAQGLPIDVDRFRRERDMIRDAIERRGFNEQLGSYTRLFDGNDLDASLLTLPLYGYIDAAHPRMAATAKRIQEQLGHGALIYRYREGTDDGLPPGEGAFTLCGFWAVEGMAKRGDLAGATDAFENLLGYANDVGLFAEEIDPATGAALGNFPQAFTHVGLINAALSLISR
jgi:GH15 family glucan-1,4-alpha-glucosidase